MQTLYPPRIITAAAAGRLLLDPRIDVRNRCKITQTVDWLAVARVTFLEILVEEDDDASSDPGQRRLKAANETEYGCRIEGLVGVPRGAVGMSL